MKHFGYNNGKCPETAQVQKLKHSAYLYLNYSDLCTVVLTN